MFSQVSGYDDEEFIEKVEIGDLSMGTNDIPVDDSNKPRVLKHTDSTPEGSFFTPWLRCKLGFFRVHLTIVGPVPEEPQSDLSLSRGESQRVLKAITDVIKAFKKELR